MPFHVPSIAVAERFPGEGIDVLVGLRIVILGGIVPLVGAQLLFRPADADERPAGVLPPGKVVVAVLGAAEERFGTVGPVAEPAGHEADHPLHVSLVHGSLARLHLDVRVAIGA